MTENLPRSAVVTGASGFIGGALVAYLAGLGYDVVAVYRKEPKVDTSAVPGGNVEVVVCPNESLLDLPQRTARKKVDYFFHLAWAGVSGPEGTDFRKQIGNLVTTCSVAQIADILGCRKVVFASSLWEFECLESLKGSDNLPPKSVYSAAKLASRIYLRTLLNGLGIDFGAAIITNVYGEGEVSNRLVSSTVRKLLKGEPTAFTAGTQTYDFIHIDDAVKAIEMIATKGLPNISYYVGSGDPKMLKEFIRTIGDVVSPGSDLGIGKNGQTGIHLDYGQFDLQGLSRDCGFAPAISFHEGIRRYSQWIEGRI